MRNEITEPISIDASKKSIAQTRSMLQKHQPQIDSTPAKADLFEIMQQFGSELNDFSTCYFGHAAQSFAPNKLKSAEDTYAKKYIPNEDSTQTSLNGFVALIDTTTFGKGNEGFYITEQAISGRSKKLFSDEIKFEFNLLSINDISVNETHLHINKKSFEYSGVSCERMEIIVACIKTYIAQYRNEEA